MVTDHIDRFVPEGILLKSGEVLEADIIATATGFNLNVLGDIDFVIDGKPLAFHETVTYRGMMFTGVPNMAWVFGYLRNSWTLRSELIADFVCRLLDHMDERGAQARGGRPCAAQDHNMPLGPWIDPENFNAGYIMRGLAPAAAGRRQARMAAHPGLLAREGRLPRHRPGRRGVPLLIAHAYAVRDATLKVALARAQRRPSAVTIAWAKQRLDPAFTTEGVICSHSPTAAEPT